MITTEECDSQADVMKMVDHLRATIPSQPPVAPPRKLKRSTVVGSLDSHPRPAGALNGTLSLNAIHYETWSYMVDNDSPAGLHVRALASGLGCSAHAIQKRMTQLMKQGYVKRVGKGVYRADAGETASAKDAGSAEWTAVVNELMRR